MKKILFYLLLFAWHSGNAQPSLYKKDTAMIAMRDGVRLFTVIYSPVSLQGKFPFIIERTPYGALNSDRDTLDFSPYPGYAEMAKDGYIFVFQDIRGKFKSEGTMEMNKPMYHTTDPSAID